MLVTDLVILRTILQFPPLFPNHYFRGRTLRLDKFNAHQTPLHGGSSPAPGNSLSVLVVNLWLALLLPGHEAQALMLRKICFAEVLMHVKCMDTQSHQVSKLKESTQLFASLDQSSK
ncbi:hypothetical protein TNCV_808921 [Trichonephila clavipes]|nr:hypothetical protein TNCV_808921 [Trichonephila clavipes]